MLQNYNKLKVINIFFEDSSQDSQFQLREISRRIKLAPISVKRYLDELAREELIIKSKHRVLKYPVYSANRDNEKFLFFKKIQNIISIRESGLIDYLANECMPNVIILFGSASKGEDLGGSDIDLFLLCKEVKLDLEKFDNKLKRKVNLFFSKNFNELSPELKNNILNGVILKGYLKVFE